MKKKMVASLATVLFMFGLAGMANAAIIEGFEDSDTIFSYYSSRPSYVINNSESSYTGDYSFKVNPSGCGANCYGYYVNLIYTFTEPTMIEGIGLWAREGSTSGSAWGGKIRVGHDSEWDLDWWGVVGNRDSITGDWQYIYVPVNEMVSSDIIINVFDITSRSSMWLDNIQIDTSPVPIPGAVSVPEPATMLLFGLGLLGLAGVKKKQQ